MITTGLSVVWATHLVEEVAQANSFALLTAVKPRRGHALGTSARSAAPDLTEGYVVLTGTHAPGD